MFCEEFLILQAYDSLQGYMVLSVTFLGIDINRVLAQNDFFAAIREVEYTEEELFAFFHALSHHIVGLVLQVIVFGHGDRLGAVRNLSLARGTIWEAIIDLLLYLLWSQRIIKAARGSSTLIN